MGSPLISIIVPVYNAGQWIGHCIESILQQTFRDFELILINDGSSDNSLTVCKDYSLSDDRIKIYTQRNLGVSATRNSGIEKASGQWISFIDADDWVDESYLETLLPADNEQLTLCLLSPHRSDSTNQKEMVKYETDICSILSNWITHVELTGPCGKLLCRSTIIDNNLRFRTDLISGEDLIFMIDYLNKITGSVRLIHKQLYNYADVNCMSLSKRQVPLSNSLYSISHISRELPKIGAKYSWNYNPSYKEFMFSQTHNIITTLRHAGSTFPKQAYKTLRNRDLLQFVRHNGLIKSNRTGIRCFINIMFKTIATAIIPFVSNNPRHTSDSNPTI